MAAGRCSTCGRFIPRKQRYCGPKCARQLKRKRDREHKRNYRDTGLGRAQREQEARVRRVPQRHYMRGWRGRNRQRAHRLDREAAARYYERHREEVLQRLAARRAAVQSDVLSNGAAALDSLQPSGYKPAPSLQSGAPQDPLRSEAVVELGRSDCLTSSAPESEQLPEPVLELESARLGQAGKQVLEPLA